MPLVFSSYSVKHPSKGGTCIWQQLPFQQRIEERGIFPPDVKILRKGPRTWMRVHLSVLVRKTSSFPNSGAKVWVRMQSPVNSAIWKMFWTVGETSPWSTAWHADALNRILSTENRDFIVQAIEACTQQAATEERHRIGSQKTREL